MRNRSISSLPSLFAPAPMNWLISPQNAPHQLDIFDITYLHFHANVELGICISGRGYCMVEGKEQPFSAGDAQIIFPFQSHLSRSVGDEYSRWHWLNLQPMQLLSAWGAPDLSRLERLMDQEMGLFGVIEREKYPLIAELIARVILIQDEKRRLACLCALVEELAGESRHLPHLHLQSSRQFDRLEPAIDLVRQSLEQGEAPSVAALAQACSLSPAPFRRAFHLVMGQSRSNIFCAARCKRPSNCFCSPMSPSPKSPFPWAIRTFPVLTGSFCRRLVYRPGIIDGKASIHNQHMGLHFRFMGMRRRPNIQKIILSIAIFLLLLTISKNPPSDGTLKADFLQLSCIKNFHLLILFFPRHKILHRALSIHIGIEFKGCILLNLFHHNLGFIALHQHGLIIIFRGNAADMNGPDG